MLIFYCSVCGKEAEDFSGLSRGDCPAIKGCKMGHNIRTASKPKENHNVDSI
jgi:hypothetical protein